MTHGGRKCGYLALIKNRYISFGKVNFSLCTQTINYCCPSDILLVYFRHLVVKQLCEVWNNIVGNKCPFLFCLREEFLVRMPMLQTDNFFRLLLSHVFNKLSFGIFLFPWVMKWSPLIRNMNRIRQKFNEPWCLVSSPVWLLCFLNNQKSTWKLLDQGPFQNPKIKIWNFFL